MLEGETDGLIKLLVDADTERFLGAATLGIAGDEIVQMVSALMHADAPCHVLAEMLPIHPTVAEFFPRSSGASSRSYVDGRLDPTSTTFPNGRNQPIN